jgi:23S rRNA pseudouridine2605 synthase
MERLQKVLSRAGIASRRASERLIVEGRVEVNGAAVTKLGTCIDPIRDVVKVDGKRIPPPPASPTFLVLNKPRGYVTTVRDPEGRPTVMDLLRNVGKRVYPVGRLDYASEGLLLFTDDGDLARDLMRPRSGVRKTYLAKVKGQPERRDLDRMCRGVTVEGRRTLPARAHVVRPGPNAWVEVTVVEGRKHQVRNMLEAIGHPVERLRRTGYGGVEIGNLPSGHYRALTPEEVGRLRRASRAALPPREHRKSG